MIILDFQYKIEHIWGTMWSDGILNSLSVIEQLTSYSSTANASMWTGGAQDGKEIGTRNSPGPTSSTRDGTY
jgi:hypothetical protein